MKPVVVDNPWAALRRFTPARIALGRSGVSQPSAAHLAFQLAHAQARDAVSHPFDVDATAASIEALPLPTLRASSAAPDRPTYLQRPDLGRRLDDPSRIALERAHADSGGAPVDLAVVVVDGLSALAVERHVGPFLGALLEQLHGDDAPWALAPVVLATQGRVAIGDEIGALLGASLVLVLIGERPGLSSPDSMGLYLTWEPRPGRHDAERNCISNVRPEGLPAVEAARRAAHLLRAARQRRLTGVALKDDTPDAPRIADASGAAGVA